ncbi:MAG TPA: Xaa-Pro peptidase family protein [Trueperaceae bacterium]
MPLAPEELPTLLDEHGLDALIVTSPANVRYLSGFATPKDGRVFIGKEGSWLLTDARYTAQAAEETLLPREIRRDWLPWVAERVGEGRLGFEADDLSVASYEDLRKLLATEPVPLRSLLRDRRMVKRPSEIDALREAARLTDAAFDHILTVLEPGMSEVDVALELERLMRSQGAEAKSFDIVVASGYRSAMPHGVASAKKLETGDLVTLDFGATVDGYHADMTRAVAIGKIDAELRAMYEAVLEALEESLAATGPGRAGADLDGLARRALARHGLEQQFAHSLGHGVGLDIHEGPQVSRNSADTLRPGMAVTIEPGVYVPGKGGVRIEELVVITEDGHEQLSKSPRHLITV